MNSSRAAHCSPQLLGRDRQDAVERGHIRQLSPLRRIADHHDTAAVEDAAVQHEVVSKTHGLDHGAVRSALYPRAVARHLAGVKAAGALALVGPDVGIGESRLSEASAPILAAATGSCKALARSGRTRP